jgi:membrane protein
VTSSEQPSLASLLLQAIRRLFADEAIPLAGNIAFRSIFSLFPFLIFLTALAGFFGTEEQAKRLINYLLSVAPEQLVRPIAGEITGILTVPRTGLLSIAALLTIWSAMSGVDSVRVGLNRAYDLKETRNTFHIYALEVVFVIGAAILLLASSFLLIILPVGSALIERHFPGTMQDFSIWHQLRVPIAMILLYGGLLVAHRLLPANPLPARKIYPGIMLTLIVWVVLTVGFAAWLQSFNSFASTYASLSGVFTAMFFIYLAAIVLILGGELNRVLDLYASKTETS